MFGYTSTSLKKNEAEKFAWENEESGHHKVLFNIKWGTKFSHFYLNAGAYDHEEEVLLTDGASVIVVSVEDVTNENGLKIYTLITLKRDYA